MRDAERHHRLLDTQVYVVHELLFGLGSCTFWNFIGYHCIQKLIKSLMAVDCVFCLPMQVFISQRE